MGRFLLVFSYIGTRYSGVQRQNILRKGKPVLTVESVLQEAIKALRPSNDVRIVLSSRTDKGVHAMKNACHVDLTYPEKGREYDPAVITNVLNYHLQRSSNDVRILQTKRVSDNFHSRLQAKGRKYVYRLGHTVKPEGHLGLDDHESTRVSFLQELRKFAPRSRYPILPVGERLSLLDTSKTFVFKQKLDINKLISAAEMISGIHNFLSFTARRKEDAGYLPHPVKMLTIGVKRGQPLGHQLQKLGCDVTKNIEFWDIHVYSKSFLYKQVRRVIGAMVLVATDVMMLDELRDILDNPRKDFPLSSRLGMSEAGLFLADIEYSPKDLEFAETAAGASSDLREENQEKLTNVGASPEIDNDSDESEDDSSSEGVGRHHTHKTSFHDKSRNSRKVTEPS